MQVEINRFTWWVGLRERLLKTEQHSGFGVTRDMLRGDSTNRERANQEE